MPKIPESFRNFFRRSDINSNGKNKLGKSDSRNVKLSRSVNNLNQVGLREFGENLLSAGRSRHAVSMYTNQQHLRPASNISLDHQTDATHRLDIERDKKIDFLIKATSMLKNKHRLSAFNIFSESSLSCQTSIGLDDVLNQCGSSIHAFAKTSELYQLFAYNDQETQHWLGKILHQSPLIGTINIFTIRGQLLSYIKSGENGLFRENAIAYDLDIAKSQINKQNLSNLQGKFTNKLTEDSKLCASLFKHLLKESFPIADFSKDAITQKLQELNTHEKVQFAAILDITSEQCAASSKVDRKKQTLDLKGFALMIYPNLKRGQTNSPTTHKHPLLANTPELLTTLTELPQVWSEIKSCEFLVTEM